ncbi:MAG: DNA-processing protein DprA [Turneriella sp.]|nr:DNA-processing protein DprA [Turneriella sp.]
MRATTADAVFWLALQLSGRTFTEKNRRALERVGSLERLAHLLLGKNFATHCRSAEKLLAALPCESLLFWHDSDYPELLRQIRTPPFVLFLRGERTILQLRMVAIVGTREPSLAGRLAAAKIVAHFVAQGFAIASGIARGIDAVAHHAALDCGGKTCAVLPNGFEHCYPLENRDLYRLAEHGQILLLSEYPPATKPQRYHFVRRNRIIAALAPLTVVVEAGEKSGALITANHALDEGRDVAALKHPHLLHNAGGERLVADGALDLTALAFG